MELLYYWVKRSENGGIQKSGFNFSPQYSFEVDVQDNHYTVKNDPDWKGGPSIFKSSVISNVTAVVGKNGAGKTTLMRELFRGDGCPYTDVAGSGFEEYNANQRELSHCIMIYQGKETPVIYHNIRDALITSVDDFPVIDLCGEGVYREVMDDPDSYYNVMKIYLSNSTFGVMDFAGMGSHGNAKYIALIPENISMLSSHYYRKQYGVDDLTRNANLWKRWMYCVSKSRNVNDFQELCDLLYYHWLIDTERDASYFSVISSNISLTLIHPLRLLERAFPVFESMASTDSTDNIPDEEIPFYQLYRFFTEFIIRNGNRTIGTHVIQYLNLFLITEYTFRLETSFPFDLSDFGAVERWIDEHRDEMNRDAYITEGLAEISELKELLDLSAERETPLPESDLAYRNETVFNRSDRETYKRFLSYIGRLFQKEESFVLRYIEVSCPGMSSGERAFQNLFSWLSLIPVFHQISEMIFDRIPDRILLLIDEIDLYLHPEWQQKFVKNMLDELEVQLPGHEIQIILATHSPLCLSDIPRENCVYLKADDDDKTYAVKRTLIKQTFGCDIYTLLDSAFFMDNITMGSFAHRYIHDLIVGLDSTETFNEAEIDRYLKMINYIGNPLIVSKLKQKLNKKAKGRLAARKRFLEAELAEVERQMEEGNDTD